MKLPTGEELRAAQERGRQRRNSAVKVNYKCGHPRSEENTFWNGRYNGCLICKREAAAKYMRQHTEPKFRLVPIYKDSRDSKTLLEQLWR